MHSESGKKFFAEIEHRLDEAITAGEDPEEAADRIIPRLFYCGHNVIHTFEHPDKRAKWECCSCKHQWVSKDGTRCPQCKDCKHCWEWVAEPYGPQDRACKRCGLPFKDSFTGAGETYEEYITRERKARERLAEQQSSLDYES